MALEDYTYMLAAAAAAARVSAAGQKLPGFAFRFAEPWLDVASRRRRHRDDNKSVERFDGLFGTGFDVDMARRAELGYLFRNVKLGDVRRQRTAANAEAALYLSQARPGWRRCPVAADALNVTVQLGQHPGPGSAGRRHSRPVRRLAAAGAGNFA
jgi:hypothetical protein